MDADAGADLSVAPSSWVWMDGSGSLDADGDPLDYVWRQVAGTPVLLDETLGATPRFLAPLGGEPLAFELVVSDGFASSTPDRVSIHVDE